MSLNYVLKSNSDLLLQTFQIGVLVGVHDAWYHANPVPEEPDIVASLVLRTIPLWSNSLKAILEPNNISLSVCSVFCHQTPQVYYSSMKGSSCELGDLLIVHLHKKSDGTFIRNALLYQAKLTAKQPYRVKTGEQDQLDLYRKWPKFKYVKSGSLTNIERDIQPKMPHTGAQYMLIDDTPPSNPKSGLLGFPNTYSIGCAMPDDYIFDHSDLCNDFLNFLLLRSGRRFFDKNDPDKDGWSDMVWDLLQSSLNKAFNRKRSGRINVPRISGDNQMLDGICFTLKTPRAMFSLSKEVIGSEKTHLLFNENNNDDIPPFRNERFGDEGGSGTSLIILETSENRNEDE